MHKISQSLILIFRELESDDSWRTAAELVETTNISKATVNRCLNFLKQEGLLMVEEMYPAWLYKLDTSKDSQFAVRLKTISAMLYKLKVA